MRARPPRQKSTIGWKELVSLPDWGITRLRAKVDTGARTSALHVEELERLPGERVRFRVVLDRKRSHRRVSVTAPIARLGRVLSSSGHYTTRVFVTTTLRIGEVEETIELNLVDRQQLSFRMLLGRTAIADHFLIDAHRAYVLKQPARGTKARE
jgi:hypothetical protein